MSEKDRTWFLIHRIHSLIHDLLEFDPQDLEIAEVVRAGEGDSS